MPEYSIGGQERGGASANEGIADIPQNRTLMALKLTPEAPVKPEIVKGLTTTEEVFGHFQPHCEVEFFDTEGGNVPETLHFSSLSDFGKKGITGQSSFLNELQAKEADLRQFAKVLKSNKLLQRVLNDPAAKEAYLNTLQALVNQLKETEQGSE